MMTVTTHPNGAATIIDIEGEISIYNAPEFRKGLMDLLKVNKVPSIIVNMSKVSHIDSAAVACLVEALKVSKELKRGFALFGLNREAEEVLELTRLNRVFEVYGTEEEAIRGMRRAPFDASVGDSENVRHGSSGTSHD